MTFDEAQHSRDRAGKFSAHVGAEQEGSLAEPVGAVADDRYDLPGSHVTEEDFGDGAKEWTEWRLDHAYYGPIKDDGKARWCVEQTEGFGEDEGLDDEEYAEVLRGIDRHSSALSHIVMHHTRSNVDGIRLRVKRDGDELQVGSFDSFQSLGTVHADGTFSVEDKAGRKVEPYTGLDYY